MVIEALINGEVLTTELIPPEVLLDIEGATWQQNVEFRQQITAMYLEQLQKKLEKFFHGDYRIEYRLVLPSKLNNDETD